MRWTLNIAKYIAGFATILLCSLIGGFIGYGIGQFFNGQMLIMLSFAGTMSGLVIGAICFVRKMWGRDLFVAEERIGVWDDQLFDGNFVLMYENATDRYIWIPRWEWEKVMADAEDGDDGEDDEDDDDSVKT